MKAAAVAALGLLGALCLCVNADTYSAIDFVRRSAVNWTGSLPCGLWDCNCEFQQPKGCCCVSSALDQLLQATFTRMVSLWERLESLNQQIDLIAGGRNIAFSASMMSTPLCFGPYNKNVSIPYQNVTLNHGHGYNPALGTFTATRDGLYFFSYTVYSNVGLAGERILYKTQLVMDGQVVSSSWEDNREDSEDSATQTVLLKLSQGNQVYVELVFGRILCGDTQGFNSFSGYLVYPTHDM
ncbi:cerebellin 18 [Brachyhypopomus gauderio]|uniref:cerebellin 18 n=1 Tax=Brachyhypopomus gauderio TaxID=698409 RepID=UPI0040436643